MSTPAFFDTEVFDREVFDREVFDEEVTDTPLSNDAGPNVFVSKEVFQGFTEEYFSFTRDMAYGMLRELCTFAVKKDQVKEARLICDMIFKLTGTVMPTLPKSTPEKPEYDFSDLLKISETEAKERLTHINAEPPLSEPAPPLDESIDPLTLKEFTKDKAFACYRELYLRAFRKEKITSARITMDRLCGLRGFVPAKRISIGDLQAAKKMARDDDAIPTDNAINDYENRNTDVTSDVDATSDVGFQSGTHSEFDSDTKGANLTPNSDTGSVSEATTEEEKSAAEESTTEDPAAEESTAEKKPKAEKKPFVWPVDVIIDELVQEHLKLERTAKRVPYTERYDVKILPRNKKTKHELEVEHEQNYDLTVDTHALDEPMPPKPKDHPYPDDLDPPRIIPEGMDRYLGWNLIDVNGEALPDWSWCYMDYRRENWRKHPIRKVVELTEEQKQEKALHDAYQKRLEKEERNRKWRKAFLPPQLE